MKKTASWYSMLGAGAIVLTGLAGCQDRNNNNQPDAPATEPQIERGLEKAGNAATEAADTAVETAAQAATTGKVKSAIMANKTIDSTKIDVDTKDKVVYLRGTVANAAQSKLAQSIAAKTAEGYTVKNELKVSGGASPAMKKEPAKR